jgi:hypothetical protein
MEARASCGVGLFILCISHARVGFAQTPERYVLSGAIFNSATRAVIAHALVSYNGPASGFRFTDVGGGFRVADAPCGQYWLNISKPGFLSESDLSPQFASLFNPAGREPFETDVQFGHRDSTGIARGGRRAQVATRADSAYTALLDCRNCRRRES